MIEVIQATSLLRSGWVLGIGGQPGPMSRLVDFLSSRWSLGGLPILKTHPCANLTGATTALTKRLSRLCINKAKEQDLTSLSTVLEVIKSS